MDDVEADGLCLLVMGDCWKPGGWDSEWGGQERRKERETTTRKKEGIGGG